MKCLALFISSVTNWGKKQKIQRRGTETQRRKDVGVYRALECLFLLLCVVGLNSCTHRPITVFSEYVSQENLASYSVNTPDPHLNSPAVGQKLYISWNVSRFCFKQFPLELKLFIRFRNRTEAVESFAINKTMGSYVYKLLGEAYFEKEGILCYKIQLLDGQELLDEWRHQIWVDLITFPIID